MSENEKNITNGKSDIFQTEDKHLGKQFQIKTSILFKIIIPFLIIFLVPAGLMVYLAGITKIGLGDIKSKTSKTAVKTNESYINTVANIEGTVKLQALEKISSLSGYIELIFKTEGDELEDPDDISTNESLIKLVNQKKIGAAGSICIVDTINDEILLHRLIEAGTAISKAFPNLTKLIKEKKYNNLLVELDKEKERMKKGFGGAGLSNRVLSKSKIFITKNKDGSDKKEFWVVTPILGTQYSLAGTTSLESLAKTLLSEVSKALDEVKNNVVMVEETSKNIWQIYLRNFLFILIIGIVVLILVFIFLRHSFLKPIGHLALEAKRIGGGDFEGNISITNKDEIGQLGWILEKMRVSIKDMVVKLEDANEDLKEMNRVKTAFFANTSHELKTPINGILGLVDACIDGAYGAVDEKIADVLNMVKKSGSRMLGIVSSILDMAKLESAKFEIKKDKVPLKTLFDEVSEVTKASIANKGSVKFIQDTDDKIMDTPVNKELFANILNNLLSNAVKFTLNGMVKAIVKNDNEVIEIAVIDTGIGINEKDSGSIFESFRQVDGSAGRQFEGAGLGLSIAKQAVDMLKGTINLCSVPKKGSAFIIRFHIKGESLDESFNDEQKDEYLQIIEDLYSEYGGELISDDKKVLDTSLSKSEQVIESESEPFNTVENGSLGLSASGKILVVDDDPINVEVAKKRLEMSGHKVITAYGGAEALDVMEKNLPDMVILDLMMPEVSGYDVCNSMRNNEKLKDIPVIMLTAKADQKDKLEGLNLGADDYLSKPFDKEELATRVKNILKNRRLRDDAAKKREQRIQREKLMMLGKVMGGVSHEIKSPLGVITQNLGDMDGYLNEFVGFYHNSPVGHLDSSLKENIKQLTFDIINNIESRLLYEDPETTFLREEKFMDWLDENNIKIDQKYITRFLDLKFSDKSADKFKMLLLSNKNNTELIDSLRIIDRLFTIMISLKEASNRMINIAKAIGEYMHYRPEPVQVDLNKSLNTTLILLNKLLKEGITVQKDFNPTSLLVVNGIEGELNQVWTNIIMNAVDEMKGKGELGIKTEQDNENILITISDSGGGIKEKDLNKIFSSYYTTKEIGKGTGLGLYISMDIIKKHQGSINVYNSDKGAVFEIRLPCFYSSAK